ncbi:MAG TPA: mycofactocin-coupled SDR family oxidoreductase [Mycobacteriales bacterium]|nr:mycofactocin-coupled SDR family oxidoreductase [Mycobacteriales bacterium]
MAGRFEGKVVLITGAARGQGRNHAVAFAREGADLVLVDVCQDIPSTGYVGATRGDLAETERLVNEAGGKTSTHVVDVRDHVALNDGVDDAVAALGVVDVVIANAGVNQGMGGLLDTPQEVWQELIDINLTGVFNTLRAGCRSMVERGQGGSVVLISSLMGLRSWGGLPGYSVSKTGLVGLLRVACHEWGHLGIRVNAIHPGTVRTPMVDNPVLPSMMRPDLTEPTLDDIAPFFSQMNLLPEPWSQADDVTNAILFLCSDAGRHITGISLPIDLGSAAK